MIMAMLSGDQVIYSINNQLKVFRDDLLSFCFIVMMHHTQTVYQHQVQLPSLQYRRLRGDMIHIYRMVNNNYSLDLSDFFTTSTSITRGHQYTQAFQATCNKPPKIKLFKKIKSTDAWNNLPECVIKAHSIDSFKNLLDQHFSLRLFLVD